MGLKQISTWLLFLSVGAQVGAFAKETDCPIVSQVKYTQMFQHLHEAPTTPMASRLEWFSRQFLGAPYVLYVLGDGRTDAIDQCPMYCLDAFDCETFVTSVLALALSENQLGYEQCLRKIRYQNAQVGFLTRNHFTSIDWNLQNQRQNRLRDITPTIMDELHRPVFQWSKTWIDREGWLSHLSLNRVRLMDADETIKLKRLAQLKQQAKTYPKVYAKLPYIPLTALFQPGGKVNQALFDQIPDGAVIEIVRPNWALKEKIGTDLDVSHLGFAFRHDGQLWFRNASSRVGRVVDEPLITYLDQTRTNPTIKGINIQVVVPVSAHCD